VAKAKTAESMAPTLIQGNNTNNKNKNEDGNDAKKSDSNNNSTTSKINNNTRSILQLMLKAQKEGDQTAKGRTLSHLEIRDEVVLFFMAGHETTAAWLYRCMFALAKFPDVQEKVYQDILIAHISPADKKEIGIEETSKMEYRCVFILLYHGFHA
jgi:hypothetical protein